MHPKLKPLSEQVLVVTGATRGIGLAVCQMAARQGARVVLGARNQRTLEQVEREIRQAGGRVASCALDVASIEGMERLADCAISHFGEIDTWVNGAGVSLLGRMERVPEKEHRRLFDTNFWGVVNGSFIGLRYVRDQGGAIINVGCVLSEPDFPLQGMVSASKHAVQGFTEAFRLEVEDLQEPVSVTLVTPAALPLPLCGAEEVARAILQAAVHSPRDVPRLPVPAPKRSGVDPVLALGALTLLGAAASFLGGGPRSRGKRAENERATYHPIERP
ncbi:MAG: SDR family NAD(P)-dependent oxidoreductase [Candidatus Eremiobacteraeota bacterium]|nr:SDR family NAD(P)-dependent oxidoreductase [Candidatus Eremiobacteraeota bacterium]